MIHFRCISIVNHWYMTVIHLLEFRTSLLTRFAISVMNSWSRVSTTVSRILIPHHACYRQIVKLKTIWLRHSAMNWLSNQCCRQGMYQLLEWHWHWTENAVKTQWNLESGKFSSNSTQLYHRRHHSSKKKLFSTAGQIEATPQPFEWLMFEKLLLMTVYFKTEGYTDIAICLST